MTGQKQKTEEKGLALEDLSSKINELAKIKPRRTVKLVYMSSCGCGYSDTDVYRDVEHDSPLQDGDRIYELEKDDRIEE
jgi:hypothetical protein